MSGRIRWTAAFLTAVLAHVLLFAGAAVWLRSTRHPAASETLTLLLETLTLPTPPEPEPAPHVEPIPWRETDVFEPPPPEPQRVMDVLPPMPDRVAFALPVRRSVPDPRPTPPNQPRRALDLPSTPAFSPVLPTPASAVDPTDGRPVPSDAQNHGPALLSSIRPRYPMGARFRGEEGIARVWVRVDDRGKPVEVALRRSSGFRALDTAAETAVWGARFKPPAPGAPSDSHETELAIRFQLTD